MKIFTFSIFHKFHIGLLGIVYLFLCLLYLQMGFSVWFVLKDDEHNFALMIGIVKICSLENCEIYPRDKLQTAMLVLGIAGSLMATLTFALSASSLCFIKAHAVSLVSSILTAGVCLSMGIVTTFQYKKYLSKNLYMDVTDGSLTHFKGTVFTPHNFPVTPFQVLIYFASGAFLLLSVVHMVISFFVYHEGEEEF
ncbi:hypothetical protein RF11_07215 [Thelohanellus kitauei]|uniref:Uncharacterized protein n=1 Tax=Thelohanellus kitauei TaxID=669202 RepID=A0A0C2J6I1_THEKT|nr:hypothetical protein RF11_07215 [Thelohanellus kitauei]